MEWGTVFSLAGLFVVGFGYLSRQLNRLEDNLTRRIDQLTERYIAHLEQHLQ